MLTDRNFYPIDPGPGAVHFTLSFCEIDGVKTVHFDGFDIKNPSAKPYGHITKQNLKPMIKFLKDALKWMEVSEETK